MRYALAAQRALAFLNAHVPAHVHVYMRTKVYEIPYIQALNIVTNLYAAHTLDTFAHVPVKREGLVPLVPDRLVLVNAFMESKVVRQILQAAIAAADAHHALAVVPRQKKIDVYLAAAADARAVGKDIHAVLGRRAARRNETIQSLDLHDAHSARAYLVDSFQVTQGRDLYTHAASRLQNRCPVGHGRRQFVYSQVYH
jgi:hypothetical protein